MEIFRRQTEKKCKTLILQRERCSDYFNVLDLKGALRLLVPWSGGSYDSGIQLFWYVLVCFLKRPAMSRRVIMAAWIDMKIRQVNASKIVVFYLSSNLGLADAAFNNPRRSFHCIYPYRVTNNKTIASGNNVFHYVPAQADFRRLVERGVVEDNIRITGSPFVGIYTKICKNRPVTKKFDICLISQMVEENLEPESDYHKKNSRVFQRLLCTVNSVYRDGLIKPRICVAMRLHESQTLVEKEINYFIQHLPDTSFEIIVNQPGSFSSYIAMEQSHFGLTLNSNVAYEMETLGTESIFARDEALDFGPSVEDVKHSFKNGCAVELSALLRKLLAQGSAGASTDPLQGVNDSPDPIMRVSSLIDDHKLTIS